MHRPVRTFSTFSGVRRILIILGVLILALVIFLPRNSQEWLGQFGSPMAGILEIPLHYVAWVQDALGTSWDQYIALQDVWDENQRLKQDLERLKGEQNALREQIIVSQQFQRLHTYQSSLQMKTVSARIIGRNASNWYRALIVDKGRRDGLLAEMGVITPSGVVGRVVTVNPTTSIVLLISDPNVAITGMLQNTRDEGIIQGTPQGQIHMKYLPPLSPVQPGDVVVTSGLTDDFPRGLQIGKIERVTKGATDLFQSGEITPTVDFLKLEGVLVITEFASSSSQQDSQSENTPPQGES